MRFTLLSFTSPYPSPHHDGFGFNLTLAFSTLTLITRKKSAVLSLFFLRVLVENVEINIERDWYFLVCWLLSHTPTLNKVFMVRRR